MSKLNIFSETSPITVKSEMGSEQNAQSAIGNGYCDFQYFVSSF